MSSAQHEISQNLYAFYDQVAQCKGVYAEKGELWSVISTNKGSWPGIIYRVTGDLDEMKESADLFSKVQSGVYPEVLIAPESNIRQIDPFLRSKGFFPFLGWKGMAREFTQNIPQNLLPEDVEIVNCEIHSDLEQWVRIVSEELISPTRFELEMAEILSTCHGISFFLLKHKGEGISTLLSYDSGNSTGFYMIATNRNYQRKGYGNMLVQQIIRKVSQQSKKPIILHATPKGEGLYAKSGFLSYNQFFLYRSLNSRP